MSSANHGSEVGAGLEVRLPSESCAAVSSTLVRLGLGCNVEGRRRPDGEAEVEKVEASELRVFFRAFQLLPAPPEVELAVRFMVEKATLTDALIEGGFVGGDLCVRAVVALSAADADGGGSTSVCGTR